MAEEGTSSESEGQDSSAEASSENTAHLTSMHIESYQEFADRQGMTPIGWAEAVAKDERAERGQNRHQGTPTSSRSRASLRAEYQAKQDWQRTVRGIQRKLWDLPHGGPKDPYAKGEGWEPGLVGFIQRFLNRFSW